MSRTIATRGGRGSTGRGRFGGRGPPPDPYYRYETIDEYFDSLPDDISQICLIQKEIDYLPDLSRFQNLKYLYCDRNNLTYLPKLPNSLEILDCGSNQLLSLPELPHNLENLQCDSNKLISLPELPDNLQELVCMQNSITSLPKLPDSLERLNCYYNQLLSLPELPENLQELECGDNKLTYLPELPDSIVRFGCDSNQLTSLPELPDSIETLSCNSNQLTSLPELPENLYHVECVDNKLTYLPELNNITYIAIVGNPIYDFVCSLKMIENDYDSDGEIIPQYYNDEYYINTIKHNLKILNRFRFLYYSFKFKNKFRDWLWKKVREPKIQQQFHPSRLLELLKDNDINDVDEETFTNW
jgi:Leucine-rich repeat (LRR) protein